MHVTSPPLSTGVRGLCPQPEASLEKILPPGAVRLLAALGPWGRRNEGPTPMLLPGWGPRQHPEAAAGPGDSPVPARVPSGLPVVTRPAARSPWGAAQTPSAEGGLCRVIRAGHGLALPADGSQAESCPQAGRRVTQSCTRRRPPRAPRASARASRRLRLCTSRTWCVCAQTCVRSRSFCLTLVFDGPRAPVSAAAVGSCPCRASPACSLHGASPACSLYGASFSSSLRGASFSSSLYGASPSSSLPVPPPPFPPPPPAGRPQLSSALCAAGFEVSVPPQGWGSEFPG